MGIGRHPARRIAIIAVASVGAAGLSGCHEILRVTFGGDDPPVHNPPPAGRAVTGSAAAATPTGRAFTGRADGRLAARATIRHGFVKSTMRNVRFIGDFTSKLSGPPMPGDESLGVLESSTWHGRFSATRNRANGKITMKGLILATFDDPSAGRACLRLSYRNARKGKRKFNRRRGASRIAILGGEGGARTLAGSATVRVTALAGGAMRLSGRVKARRGPERGFPAACAKLEKTFGLQPLPNR